MPLPDITSLLADVRATLTRAVVDAKHEWHLPVVSTMDLQGRPTARTVVFRRLEWEEDETAPVLKFHTDARSRKVAEIQGCGDVAWVFYDRRRKIQLRASGVARVHHRDEVADEGWARTSLSSRRCYLAPHAPSTVLEAWDSNLPPDLRRASPDEAASEAGRAAFSVVSTRVDRLEWVELHHDGHRRAEWSWTSDGVQAAWLAP